jgi:DNA primase
VTSFHPSGGIFRAICPFADEDGYENLFIYPDPPRFVCFGCGARGTIANVEEGFLLRADA